MYDISKKWEGGCHSPTDIKKLGDESTEGSMLQTEIELISSQKLTLVQKH